jgi:uncharacterized protein (TIGR02145 family)
MKNIIFLIIAIVFFTTHNQAQTVTDIDGNVYNTVSIGTQTWMKENLKVTHYNNGTPIPYVKNGTDWHNLTTGARAYYNNDSALYAPIHGAIYNWYATTDICPANWHVPVENDFIILAGYLGGTSVAGGKLKSVTGWISPNTGATNSSGFSGLPGGDRYDTGPYNYMGFFGHWWASTPNGGSLRMAMLLSYDNEEAIRYYFDVNNGFLIRCVCDFTTSQNNYDNVDKLIQVYPSPASDKITVFLTEENNSEVVMYNMTGAPVLKSKLSKDMNEIDISSLSKGMYIIKVTTADWTVQKKIIKE